jgi:hypothetical protein
MAQVDKQISAARRFALLLLTISFAAAFLVGREVQTWRKIGRARELMAYWFVCNMLRENLELLDRLGRRNDSPASFTHLYAQHIEGKFQVEMPQKSGDPFWVFYEPNRRLGDNEPALFPEHAGHRPWNRKIISSRLEEANRELTTAEAVRIAKARASPRSPEARDDPRHEHMSKDPRWAAAAFGMTDAEGEFGVLTGAPRGEDRRIDLVTEYFKFERAATSAEFKVPLLDVTMSTDLALWILMLLLLLQCILLSDAVSNIQGSVGERDEPWLLLDYNTGSAAAVARVWLAFILLAPILTATAHLIYLSVRFSSGEGSRTNLILTGIVLSTLAAFGTRLTFRTIQSLRQARRQIAERPRC